MEAEKKKIYFGPFSKAVDLSEDDLLTNNLNPINQEIKKGLILELYSYVQKNNLKLDIFTDSVKKILPPAAREGEAVDIDSQLRKKG